MAKRFDFEDTKPTVSCGDCEHYYTSACDGRDEGCKSFKFSRNPRLERRINRLTYISAITMGLAVANLLLFIFLH